MATIGFYTPSGKLIEVSAVGPENVEYRLDEVEREAQTTADECGVEIIAWARDDAGEQTRTIGVSVQPRSR